LAINRVTGVGVVVVWTTTVGYCRQKAGKSSKLTGQQWHCKD